MEFISGQGSEETLAEVKAWIGEGSGNVDELLSTERAYLLTKTAMTTDEQIEQAELRVARRVAAMPTDRTAGSDATTVGTTPTFTTKAWRWMAAAASILILLGVATLWMPGNNADYAEMLEAKAPANSTLQLLLADGTKVWLNEGSTLHYPKEFEGDLRQVSLDGEGYFEVAKNAAKPFIVESSAMSVRVLGTKFNFRNTDETGGAEVTLVEGSVEVRGLHDEGMLVLQPGQKAEIDADTRRLKVSEVDASIEAIWHDDYIPFHNADIQTIAHTLEAVYKMAVVVGDNFDAGSTYSGYIRRKESIDSVLTSLQNTIPMSYSIRGKVIYLNQMKD